MKKLIMLSIVLIVGCGGLSNIEQEGYFKSSVRDRIFVFSFQPSVTESEIKSHAKKQTNTAGRFTACYYFKHGALIPRDGITLAGSVFRANNVINQFADGIEYAYMKNLNGTYSFSNCRTHPNDDLCINHQ